MTPFEQSLLATVQEQDPSDIDVWSDNNLNIPDLLQIAWQGDLISRNSLYYNGCVYATGVKTNDIPGQRNQIVIVKHDGTTNPPTFATVGTGTVSQDIQNHPRPSLLIDGSGFIYLFQTNTHQDPIDVWKSDNPEDITAFTKIVQIPELSGINYGYPKSKQLLDNSINLLVRTNKDVGLPTESLYNTGVLKSTNAAHTTWTIQEVADADFANTSSRHYHNLVRSYGTSIYDCFITSFRNEGTNTYYKFAVTKTIDWVTYSNASGLFSKDVDTNGMITNAEMDANFIVKQASSPIIELGFASACKVNDIIYMYNLKENAIAEFTRVSLIDGSITTADVTIPNVNTFGQFNFCQFSYNGTDILCALRIVANQVDETNVITLDQTTLAQTLVDGTGGPAVTPPRLDMPQNYQDVPNGQLYMQYITTTQQIFYYRLTTLKY